MRRPCLLWASVAIASLSAVAFPQALRATRVSKPPVIDGVIGEDEWKDVPFFEGLHDSSTGAAYADSGRFWLAYDKDFVYFAARLQESQPHEIRSTEYRTNVSLGGDDFIELDLDLSGSLSAFNTFQINPQGATNIHIAGGRAAKREWMGEFEAKARITATGWEAEAKIPWKAMSIPKAGARDVRFNIARFVARLQRTFSYTFVPATQTALTPTWSAVELPNPSVDRSIRLLPYGYAGYDAKRGPLFNSGLDMRAALTDQINVVGSLNPDFRNVAEQILSIDFSRFERLAGESRPFFQEGAQYSNSQIFASQRIPSFDIGVNTYGRISDKLSLSAIQAERFGKESDTILNLSDDPNPNTSLRGSFTSQDQDGLGNQSYLARLSQNVGSYNLFLRTMGSQGSTLGLGMQNDAYLTYSKSGFSVNGGYSRADKNFNPSLGFAPEVNFQGPTLGLEYARSFDHGRISDTDFSIGAVTYSHTDGSFYRNEQGASGSVTLKPGVNILGNVDLADFEGSKDSLYSAQVSYPHGNPYNSISVRYDAGRQAGFQYRSRTVAAAYRATKRLQFTLRQQTVTYEGIDTQTIFSANYDLGSDRSISGRAVQHGKRVNAYIAYSRSGNKGIEYFFILGDPNAQSYRNSFIVKVTVPITLGRTS